MYVHTATKQPVKCMYDIYPTITGAAESVCFEFLFVSAMAPMTVKIGSYDAMRYEMDRIGPPKVENVFHGVIIIIITSDICQINRGKLEMEFFSTVMYFIIQIMDKSCLNISIPIKFNLFIDAMAPLALNLIVQATFSTTNCPTQETHNVCGVFYDIRLFVYFLLFFEFTNVIY